MATASIHADKNQDFNRVHVCMNGSYNSHGNSKLTFILFFCLSFKPFTSSVSIFYRLPPFLSVLRVLVGPVTDSSLSIWATFITHQQQDKVQLSKYMIPDQKNNLLVISKCLISNIKEQINHQPCYSRYQRYRPGQPAYRWGLEFSWNYKWSSIKTTDLSLSGGSWR